jgi:hypothetical protein
MATGFERREISEQILKDMSEKIFSRRGISELT